MASTHKVAKGETLFGIAKKYGLSVDELKALNGLKDNNLKIGQTLIVQKNPASSPKPTANNPISGSTHTVQAGETLFSIARKYGITVALLKTLNALKNNVLKLGQILKINRTSPNTNATSYTPPSSSPAPTDSISQQKIQFGINFTGGIITGMSDNETRAYAANVAYTESRFRHQIENDYGYLGLYQFGAAALVEAGLIQRSRYQAAVQIHGSKLANGANASIHKAFIADSSNWAAGHSKQHFLNNPHIQHQAFVAYTNNNIQYATPAAKRAMQGNLAKIAAYMKMAHLLEYSRASEGTVNPNFDASDKNQTSMQQYGLGAANEIRTLAQQIAQRR